MYARENVNNQTNSVDGYGSDVNDSGIFSTVLHLYLNMAEHGLR